MSQVKIVRYLEKNRGQLFSAREISEALGEREDKIIKNLNQLHKYKEAESIEINVKLARKIFGKNIDKGMRLWWIE